MSIIMSFCLWITDDALVFPSAFLQTEKTVGLGATIPDDSISLSRNGNNLMNAVVK